jgi:hypothetical protein
VEDGLRRTHHFIAGFLWGAGLYVVLDYLAFHYYDVPAAAERILKGVGNDGAD